MKTNEDGARLCDSVKCEFIATHTLVWDAPQYYCAFHARGALDVALHMGFPTPSKTFRNMTPDEMMPDEPEP